MKQQILKLSIVLILLSQFISVKVNAQCANVANIYSFTYGGKNYELIKENRTWAQAAACAVERGGYLVHIDSLPEQTAVYNAVVSSGISTTYNPVNDGGGTSYLWIGATDKMVEGTWLWDGNNDSAGVNFWNGQGFAGNGTGAAVSGKYVNWGGTSTTTIQEPDDFNSSQDAAAIALAGWPSGTTYYGTAGEWNDIDVNNSIYYIVEIDNATGINNIKSQDVDYLINPNPGNGLINLVLQDKENIQVDVVNLNGQTFYNETFSNTQRTQIDLSNQPKGMYFVKVQSNNIMRVEKIIIQ